MTSIYAVFNCGNDSGVSDTDLLGSESQYWTSDNISVNYYVYRLELASYLRSYRYCDYSIFNSNLASYMKISSVYPVKFYSLKIPASDADLLCQCWLDGMSSLETIANSAYLSDRVRATIAITAHMTYHNRFLREYLGERILSNIYSKLLQPLDNNNVFLTEKRLRFWCKRVSYILDENVSVLW